MKILLLNTYSQTGGAAIACQRLLHSLQKQADISTQMLVHEGKNDAQILSLQEGFWNEKKGFTRFVAERLAFLPYEAEKKYRFAFSPARFGVNISKHPAVLEADILHLHWVNFGFLSLKNLKQLFSLQKPIVWTLHDMWTFTGGCHYAKDCLNYEQECGNCQFLKKPKQKDLSHQIFLQKQELFPQQKIHFVTCSHWLKSLANKSSLLKNEDVRHIPNPIDSSLYKALDKKVLQKKYNLSSDKFYLLFGAMNIADERKGFAYLQKSLVILQNKYPEINKDLNLLVFGKSDEEMLTRLPYPHHNLGLLKTQEAIIEAYNLGNTFVIPTLQDNLPNTVLESLACQTPVLGFHTGGIPEMVFHQENGFLADYKNSESLAEGIFWLWNTWKNNPEIYQQLQKKARKIVLEKYNEQIISQQYIHLYQSLIEK